MINRMGSGQMARTYVADLQAAQRSMAAAQQRISTGKEMIRPSDDPVGIAIVILGLLPRAWLNDGVWKGATILAILMGVYDLVASLAQKMGSAMPAALQHMHEVIPLSTSGFAWLLPALVGGLVGGGLWKLSGRSDAGAADAERLPAE